jgi:diguanylate cyclase (GGDEF)-like protein
MRSCERKGARTMTESDRPTAQPSILVIDDDPSIILALSKALNGLGSIRFATRGEDGLRLARERPPDLVLLDAEMPGMTGFEVCKQLKEDPLLAQIPVIFVTSHGDEDFEQAGLDLGAADFIAKPIRPRVVAARAKTQLRLKLVTDQLRRQATTDGLTGLENRRVFDEMLSREWRRARRNGHPLSLLMLDVDYFKRYNDHYGHALGDECLIKVAGVLTANLLRAADLAARYGGEEFVIVLPSTDRGGAQQVGMRVLRDIENLDLPHSTSELGGRLTLSVGISSYDEQCSAWVVGGCDANVFAASSMQEADLLKAADLALYAAKAAGRAQQVYISVDDALAGSTAEAPAQ